MSGKRRVLVTGAGGLIGGFLVKRLLERPDIEVIATDIKPMKDWYQWHTGINIHNKPLLDLNEQENIRHIFKLYPSIDHVFMLACDMGGIGFIENNKLRCMLSVQMSTNVLRTAAEYNVKKFFYASSACAYPVDIQNSSEAVGLKESDAYPANPEDGYGWEKLFTERMCRHFMEDTGMKTYVARFHNVYGTHTSWNDGREKAPAAICRKVAQAKIDGSNVIDVWGDGEQTRSFCHVDDCVEGILRLVNSEVHHPVNIGSDRLISINDLISMVAGIASLEDYVTNHDLSAPQGVKGRNSDNSHIQEVLGWSPSISLESGMPELYSWIYGQML